ncbi:MAG: ATP-binding protein [Gammaproteobacteria bacterium]|nr:ATP-binding protein [Gammaproteobacteria bacterium]MDP2348536.1 ATP-binding protein [Gammaproteobacteria bacterium]
MSRELELSLPAALSRPMQACVMQCGQSVVNFLQGNNQEALANSRVQLTRLGGLCRLLGARRAALFCIELDALLLCFSSGGAQSVRMLVGKSVVQLQQFLARLSRPASDEEFDMARINMLRTARGKMALPVDSSCCERSTVGAQFPLPDFPHLVLEKIATLQAGMNGIEDQVDPEAQREHGQHLAGLASLLQVCGLPMEMRCLPRALVHLELHFRYLLEHYYPCYPECLRETARLDVGDYLLFSAHSSLVSILNGKLVALVSSLAEIANDRFEEALTPGISIAAKELIHISGSIHLLSHSGISTAISDNLCYLMKHGEELCRNMHCSVGNVYAAAESGKAGGLLLLRVLLLARKILEQSGKLDRQGENLVRKIARDCERFVSQRQRDLRCNMMTMHRVDNELLACANNEIEHYRSILSVCLDESRNAHGIHYVSETLCTTVSKLSLAMLSVGQAAFHAIVEALRGSLTLGLEHQQGTDPLLQNVLASLCGILQRPLPVVPEEAWLGETELQQFSECIDLYVTQTKWSLCVAESAVSIECRSGDESESRARIAIELLPLHLARNIRDLLFCAEELAKCAGNPESFEALNRRLIVELRMLASGARALYVHRVARLSTVLAEVHQALAGRRADLQADIGNAQHLPMSLLVMAHRQLRSGLNQAAARQEVSSNREIIAALYQWLEDHSRQVATSQATESFEIFLRETEEIMAAIEEGARKPPGDCDTRSLLHHLHTLKGNARLFSCDVIATLCHRCEQSLLSAPHTLHSASAVAEASGGAIYSPRTSGVEASAGSNFRRFTALAQELRAAIDELTSLGNRPEDGHAGTHDKYNPARIPLAQAQERGIVIPAVSLQRMAELAVAARTGSRAMSDVLQSCSHNAEPTRLALLGDLLIEQERCTVQLDEEIAGSRQISFARLTPRLQRLVGRHANLLDRQLRFSVCNDELRADRLLVESLVAPLEHLLRNALDHGIESVQERRARGKPDSGTITLSLKESENSMEITLTDDGAGIDPDALTAHAMRLGLSVDLQAGAKERLQWLFLPGFSSRELATEDAGHGIGLAMVDSTVVRLGGRVEVESMPGQGSCFRIVLPR